ncbi:MAG: metal ABC transporter ATP-binding protein [Bacteroidales bacterium]|jgi:iron/zinc/copper transport system ATP-binding protein|nr:metal ABC transporter ATP-binding protein [Bacteroidales bacterium]MDY0370490.1 metal ABC transporter ATP-binding protein [Bacteroidales bacterium]
MKPYLLELSNLNVSYPNGIQALSAVNLKIDEGGLWGILGPNGSGKTTLLKAILGLLPHNGKVLFRAQPIKKSAKQIAYVEQKGDFDMDFPITVFQCVLTGTYPKLGLFKKPGSSEKQAVLDALDKLGLIQFKNRQIGQLSGGQFQRVLIARMLVQNADLIFLDEPFIGIDMESEALIIHHLKQMALDGHTIIMVHHDLKAVREYFDKLILVNRTVVDYGATEDIFIGEKLKQVFPYYHEVALA